MRVEALNISELLEFDSEQRVVRFAGPGVCFRWPRNPFRGLVR